MVKNPPANAGDTGDTGLISGLQRSPGVGNGNSIQYSCWDNPMERREWRAKVHRVTKSQKLLGTDWPKIAAKGAKFYRGGLQLIFLRNI